MDFKPDLSDLKTPQDIVKLISAISELAEEADTLYSEVAPNGSISARQGRLCLYNNSLGSHT